MNIKREIIALAVRVLADHSSTIRKPDSIELLLNSMFGMETYDQQLARQIESDFDRATTATKRAITNHKFKRIIQNI